MKINYDPKYNVAYISLREKHETVETLKISDELNIDIAADGRIFGIELLNATEQLEIIKQGKLEILEERSGRKLEVAV